MTHQPPSETELTVSLGAGRTITAVRTDAAQPASRIFLYAPGAGANIRDPFGAYLCHELAELGVAASLRFQFPSWRPANARRTARPSSKKPGAPSSTSP